MSDPQLLTVGAGLAGFLLGVSTFYLILKFKAEIANEGGDFLRLKLAILGGLRTNIRVKHAGLDHGRDLQPMAGEV